MASNNTRSLKHLRDDGWTAEVVEKFNPHSRTRNDLFGFIDILAIKEGQVLGVQTTSAGHVSDRVRKIQEHENLDAVLASGMDVVCHGWAKVGNRWRLKKQVWIKGSRKVGEGSQERTEDEK